MQNLHTLGTTRLQTTPYGKGVGTVYTLYAIARYIESIENYHEEYLSIFSRAILAKLRDRDKSWETMVPPEVAECIKENQFFGYQP